VFRLVVVQRILNELQSLWTGGSTVITPFPAKYRDLKLNKISKEEREKNFIVLLQCYLNKYFEDY
jgi:hypothetical protein